MLVTPKLFRARQWLPRSLVAKNMPPVIIRGFYDSMVTVVPFLIESLDHRDIPSRTTKLDSLQPGRRHRGSPPTCSGRRWRHADQPHSHLVCFRTSPFFGGLPLHRLLGPKGQETRRQARRRRILARDCWPGCRPAWRVRQTFNVHPWATNITRPRYPETKHSARRRPCAARIKPHFIQIGVRGASTCSAYRFWAASW